MSIRMVTVAGHQPPMTSPMRRRDPEGIHRFKTLVILRETNGETNGESQENREANGFGAPILTTCRGNR